MLEVHDLQVNYGTIHAVRGVHLQIRPGESVCLLGPNGAGKSSTLGAIAGTTPARGLIRLDGEDVTRLSAAQRARRGLVLVPEGRHVFGTLSVAENLKMGRVAAARRSDRVFDEADVYDLFPQLSKLRGRAGGLLSGGEQQMVALGRALVSAPRVLMVDEPSLGLSPAVCQDVFAALRQISVRVPLLLVEQSASAALKVCDRGHVLLNGRSVLSGSREDLANRGTLLATYLGQQDVLPPGHETDEHDARRM